MRSGPRSGVGSEMMTLCPMVTLSELDLVFDGRRP